MNLDKFKKVTPEEPITIECEDYNKDTKEETAYKVVIYRTQGKFFNKARAETLTLIAEEEIPSDSLFPVLLRKCIVSVERDGEPLSSDEIDDLVIENPVLCEYLDQQASKRANFIKPLSGGSSTTPTKGSGSKSQKKAAKA